jgi:F-type H+-transporting ATPase subunit b
LWEAARRDSSAEAERLLGLGRAEIEKIKQAARVELAASERAAQQELRAIAASMAVERAAALVRSRMNGQVRARIFQAFVGELARGAN